MTKLPQASSGGFSPSFSTWNGGASGSPNLRVGGWAKALEHARTVNRIAIAGLRMRSLIVVWRVTPLAFLTESASVGTTPPRKPASLAIPLARRLVNLAGLPGHDRLARLL